MGLLDRHVATLKSEEVVLGCSGGWQGEKGSKQEGLESTKLVIISASGKKGWNGFTAIEQTIADSRVGVLMEGKQFPARCLISYKRVAAEQKSSFEGKETTKDVEKLVVVGIEYLAAVDLVDVKIKPDQKAA